MTFGFFALLFCGGEHCFSVILTPLEFTTLNSGLVGLLISVTIEGADGFFSTSYFPSGCFIILIGLFICLFESLHVVVVVVVVGEDTFVVTVVNIVVVALVVVNVDDVADIVVVLFASSFSSVTVGLRSTGVVTLLFAILFKFFAKDVVLSLPFADLTSDLEVSGV